MSLIEFERPAISFAEVVRIGKYELCTYNISNSSFAFLMSNMRGYRDTEYMRLIGEHNKRKKKKKGTYGELIFNTSNVDELLLHYVIRADLDNVIKTLIDGACATAIVSSGVTVIGQAVQDNLPEILQVLIQSCEEGEFFFRSLAVPKSTEDEDDSTPEGMDNLEWDDEIESSSCTATQSDGCCSMYMYYAKTFERTGEILVNTTNSSSRQDPHTIDNFSKAPIHYAAAYGHIRCLEILLQNKSPIDITTSNGVTPLHLGVEHESVVRLLLNHGANPNRKTFTDGESPLHYAIKRGNFRVVQLLLKAGACVNDINFVDHTPLMLAIKYGEDAIALTLVEKGAKINLEDMAGRTALYYAVDTDNMIFARYLLEHGARKFVSQQLLHHCVDKNYREMAELLLNYGENLNMKNGQGHTPIEMALHENNAYMLELFLGFSDPIPIDFNYAVEQAPCTGSFKDVARVLLEYGVQLNPSKICCITPLIRAILGKKITVAEILIREGADVSIICSFHILEILRMTNDASTQHLHVMLINAGLNLHRHEILLKTLNWHTNQNPMLKWVICQLQNPMSLQGLCRIKVRRVLIANLYSPLANTENCNMSRLQRLIQQTGVPVPLQKYLCDIDKISTV